MPDANSRCAVFLVEDEADDDVRPSNFASMLPKGKEDDWGLQEAEDLANRYKAGEASLKTSKAKRDLRVNEYWLVPVRVCGTHFHVEG